MLASGELESLIQAGLGGVRLAPDLLRRVILAGTDYDDDLSRLTSQGAAEPDALEVLLHADAGRAADLLRPTWDRTRGAEGHVSLWLNPELAEDTEAMVGLAARLHRQIGRPNLMLEIPATPGGIEAMRLLLAQGCGVNATLVFSIEVYQKVAEAHIQGLTALLEADGDLAATASVVSLQLSGLDDKLDRILAGLGADELHADLLSGKSGIALAKAAHAHRREIYRRAEWSQLVEAGARQQRLLFHGALPLDPTLPETHYLEAIVGSDTVCALSGDGLDVLRRWEPTSTTLDSGLEGTQQRLQALADLGIDMAEVGRELQRECLAEARRLYQELQQAIPDKHTRLASGRRPLVAELGELQAGAEAALDELEAEHVLPRIWARDHTVWQPEPTEIANRLGWLRAARTMQAQCHRLDALAAAFRADGYGRVVLLGMGGSSLAPEMFARVFGSQEGHPELCLLDTTVPGTIHDLAEQLDLRHTAFIVSSKSGTTQETLSLFKYFYRRTVNALGEWRAGEHFLVVTDPGTPLAALAERLHLRGALLNDPNLGGRYSALSYFGLAPAAVIGVDIRLLLDRAMQAASATDRTVAATENPAARLGAILAQAAQAGKDKLTLLAPSGLESFGDWVEQLIAESTGKQGTGIVPVVGEAPTAAEVYADDRLFVQLQLGEEAGSHADLLAAGHPLVRLQLRDRYDLGGQLFVWEMATAVAGRGLGINPFDQPNVEAAKALARQVVEVRQSAQPPSDEPAAAAEDGLALYTGSPDQPPGSASIESLLSDFLDGAQPGGYLALQAYLQPTPAVRSALDGLRRELRDRTRLATTLGYGPRYLHSTGQLHKGDAGKGLFLQFTADDPLDLEIPDDPESHASSLTFGAVKAAQAQGDRLALLQAGRQVLRADLGVDPEAGLERLRAVLK